MEVPVSSKEWEIDERPADSSKASWVFNMGRNIMITSLFVSSVPFVLPPLLMVSALGFAFSFPFGVMFASYTCTEKIMSKLLPLPGPSPLMFDYGEENESVIEAEERNQLEDNIHWVDQEEEKEPSARDDEEKEVGYEEDMGEYLEGKDVAVEGEDDVAVEGEVHPLLVVAAIGQISVGEGDSNIKEDDFSRETTDLLEIFKEEDNNTENTLEDRMKTKKSVDEKENESNKQPNAGELSYVSNGNRLETDGFGSVDGTHKDNVKDVNGTPEARADEKPETELGRIDTQVSSKDATTEEQQEEEKIRKQMNALREIIGSKGFTSGSCVDELKALFAFTGVEPPPSFKEQTPLPLAEVYDSLQFLKSVVGVK